MDGYCFGASQNICGSIRDSVRPSDLYQVDNNFPIPGTGMLVPRTGDLLFVVIINININIFECIDPDG